MALGGPCALPCGHASSAACLTMASELAVALVACLDGIAGGGGSSSSSSSLKGSLSEEKEEEEFRMELRWLMC